MKSNIIERWESIGSETPSEARARLFRDGWDISSLDKWASITTESKTAKGILAQFNETEWRTYKAYNPRYSMWEYMVLLKLVYFNLLDAVWVQKSNSKKFQLHFRRRFTPKTESKSTSYYKGISQVMDGFQVPDKKIVHNAETPKQSGQLNQVELNFKPVSIISKKTLPLLDYDVIVHSFAGMQGALVMKVKAGSEAEALDIAAIRLDDLLESCEYEMIIG